MRDALQQAQQVFRDVAQRGPQYLDLAQRLANDVRLAGQIPALPSGAERLTGAAFRLLPGLGGVLRSLQTLLRGLRMLQAAVRTARPDVVDEHLAAVGLTRDQLDADVAALTAALAQLGVAAKNGAADVLERGARFAGKMVGRGLRALRSRRPPDKTTP